MTAIPGLHVAEINNIAPADFDQRVISCDVIFPESAPSDLRVGTPYSGTRMIAVPALGGFIRHEPWRTSQRQLSIDSGVAKSKVQKIEEGGNCTLDTAIALGKVGEIGIHFGFYTPEESSLVIVDNDDYPVPAGEYMSSERIRRGLSRTKLAALAGHPGNVSGISNIEESKNVTWPSKFYENCFPMGIIACYCAFPQTPEQA